MEVITKLLHEVRKEAGLTLQKLADKSGVPYSTIQRIEAEKRVPPIETAYRIANALNVRPLEMWPELYDRIYPLMKSLREQGL